MRRRLPSLLEEDSFEEPLINLTPLIDVVFVVLITFILIAPALDIDPIQLAASSGLDPKKDLSQVQNAPISITIQADNSIWYQGKSLSLKELEGKLKAAKKQSPQATPQLLQDSRAQFGTYQSVKNLLETLGFEEMDVVLKG